jgi:hypothetical protein
MPPMAPDARPPLALVSADLPKHKTVRKRTAGVCQPVPNFGPLPPVDQRGDYGLSPIAAAKDYLFTFEHRKISGMAKIAIIRYPVHGQLTDEGIALGVRSVGGPSDEHMYNYLPAPGYLGKDHATMIVDIGGYSVRVEYFFQAVERQLGNTGIEDLCRHGYSWKIAGAGVPSSRILKRNVSASDLS